MHATILALACFGDGDAVMDDHVLKCYVDNRWWTPYHNAVIEVYRSLRGAGANQHGGKGSPYSGYESFFQLGALGLPLWDAATGENTLGEYNPFNDFPNHMVYTYLHRIPGTLGGGQSDYLEMITGQATGDMQGLSKYLWDEWSSGDGFNTVDKMIFGDRRVTAQSPATLSLPTSVKSEAAEIIHHRNSWNITDDVFSVSAKHMNIRRYPMHPGLISWYVDDEAVIPCGPLGKGGYAAQFNAAAMAWEYGYQSGETWAFETKPNTPFNIIGGSWYGDHWFGGASRMWNGYPNAVRQKYPNQIYDAERVYHGLYSTLEYTPDANGFFTRQDLASSLWYSPVTAAERRVDWDANTQTAIITDIWSGFPSTGKVAMKFPLPTIPDMSQAGSGIVSWQTISGNHTVTLTVTGTTPVTINWWGGLNNELLGPVGPNGELHWLHTYGKGIDPGFSAQANLRKKWGIGQLWIQPTTGGQTSYPDMEVTIVRS